ncbi:MAG: pantoate--beta-alanine ligase, partial [Planctomycetota bacterium]
MTGSQKEGSVPAGVKLISTPAVAAAWCARERAAGKTIGLIPTMGALHEGHLHLVRRAVAENDHAIVSVFVNPLQFDDPSDLVYYPRDLNADVQLVDGAGCSMVFTGTLAGFFPEAVDEGAASGAELIKRISLLDPGPVALGLEGACRSGHFEGVATIVKRLFQIAQPTRAYFGAKDYQQTAVVRGLVPAGSDPEVV